LEDWLPAAWGDVYESYEDNIICRDPTLAGQPGGRHAMLPFTFLLRSQSHEELPRDSDGELTRRNLHTTRATRAASAPMEIVL
jgi:hypothetical protein